MALKSDLVRDVKGMKEPPDKTRIATSQDLEMNWWSKQLGVPRPKIVEAVKSVGNTTVAVKKYFGIK
jgi:hypothetical protein